MKRDGYIIEEVVEQGNLEASFDTVVRGRRKRLREGRWLLAHRSSFLSSVREELLAGRISLYPAHRAPTAMELATGGYVPKEIRDGGKERCIQVFCMAARIKVNAVMSVVDSHLRRRYIRTTSASIAGRGMHDLKAYIERDLREHSDELRYWYKFDIRKFYETAGQDFIMYALRRVFKDGRLLALLEPLVRLMPRGMSIGLRASQGMCNLLLSVNLDHYLKDRLGVKYFYRYCDDGVIGAATKSELWALRARVHECVGRIGQEIKGNERISPVEAGLDFLGYVIYPDGHSRLRKRVKQNFLRKLQRVRSRKRRRELVGSLWGMAKHAPAWHLLERSVFPREFNRLKRNDRRKTMKRFSELGIKYTPADGKKRFSGRAMQLRQLVNVTIRVTDFEREVVTKYGKRYLVQYYDMRTGEECKFFTDCEEMKYALDEALAMDAIPFEATIAMESFDGGNKVKYKFT